MTEDTARAVNAFFDSYRAAFERMDAAAIADHFAYPSHIASDTGEVMLMPVAARDPWIDQVEHLLGMYRSIGVAAARIRELRPTELSPGLVQAVVRWELLDGAGRALYDFVALYTLARVEGRLRIAAIAHNEIPRYREALARARA